MRWFHCLFGMRSLCLLFDMAFYCVCLSVCLSVCLVSLEHVCTVYGVHSVCPCMFCTSRVESSLTMLLSAHSHHHILIRVRSGLSLVSTSARQLLLGVKHAIPSFFPKSTMDQLASISNASHLSKSCFAACLKQFCCMVSTQVRHP